MMTKTFHALTTNVVTLAAGTFATILLPYSQKTTLAR